MGQDYQHECIYHWRKEAIPAIINVRLWYHWAVYYVNTYFFLLFVICAAVLSFGVMYYLRASESWFTKQTRS